MHERASESGVRSKGLVQNERRWQMLFCTGFLCTTVPPKSHTTVLMGTRRILVPEFITKTLMAGLESKNFGPRRIQ